MSNSIYCFGVIVELQKTGFHLMNLSVFVANIQYYSQEFYCT
jgi:hypothetical protein